MTLEHSIYVCDQPLVRRSILAIIAMIVGGLLAIRAGAYSSPIGLALLISGILAAYLTAFPFTWCWWL